MCFSRFYLNNNSTNLIRNLQYSKLYAFIMFIFILQTIDIAWISWLTVEQCTSKGGDGRVCFSLIIWLQGLSRYRHSIHQVLVCPGDISHLIITEKLVYILMLAIYHRNDRISIRNFEILHKIPCPERSLLQIYRDTSSNLDMVTTLWELYSANMSQLN